MVHRTLAFNNLTCGFWSPNVGMTGPKGKAREPNASEHGTFVIWNAKTFLFEGFKIPEYQETSCVHGSSEIGIRSTYFIKLTNIKTNDSLMVMSLHGNGGAKNDIKRKILIESIFNQIIINFEIPCIIGGDFNTERDKFLEITKKYSGKLNVAVNKGKDIYTHIDMTDNNSNTNKWYLDYIVSNCELTLPELSGDFGRNYGLNNDHKQVKTIISL